MQYKLSQLNPHPDNAKIYGVEDVSELAEQIKQSEWIKPLVITDFYGGFTIVSGHRRFAASQMLNLESVPCEIQTFQHEWQIGERLLLENRSREKTEVQKLREYRYWKGVEEGKAKTRLGGRHKDESTVDKCPQLEEGKSRDIAAEQTGINSGKTAERGEKALKIAETLKAEGKQEEAELILEAINEDNYSGAKTLAEDILAGAIPAEIVKQVLAEKKQGDKKPITKKVREKKREKDIQQQKHDIETGALPTLTGKFSVVSIDPPWPYGREYDPDGSRAANPYPEMSIADVTAIELPLEKDAVIFLWTTHAFLPDAFNILRGWGAQYKATMVWNKKKIGMGAWFRMQCEFCLVGIVGKPFWSNTRYPEIIEEPRREHSRKPDAFFELVSQITAGRKLEYFSREAREGWEIFGNDINKF